MVGQKLFSKARAPLHYNKGTSYVSPCRMRKLIPARYEQVWPHLAEPEDVEWSLNNSLHMLGTDYVDCFLIHWPFAAERNEDRDVKLGPNGKVC